MDHLEYHRTFETPAPVKAKCADCGKPWDGYATMVETGEKICKPCSKPHE